MRKLAYVLMDDLMHPARRMMPLLGKYIPYGQWQVCVLTGWDDICSLSGAPDLIINFKDSRDNWRQETPDWYEDAFSDRIADYVVKGGCGYLAVHAGLLNIPRDHPIKTEVLQGGIDVDAGKPVFTSNMLFGKVQGMPFGLYADISFIPQGNHPILKGVDGFTVRDEQCKVTMLPDTDAEILGYTESKEAGRTVGAWAREAGNGRAAGISMGHLSGALTDPAMIRLISNAVSWCAGEA